MPGMPSGSALPNLVVIGAMKCGTTALHRLLDEHPQIAMSSPKELNFFIGPADAPRVEQPGLNPARAEQLRWTRGNWHRSIEWYAQHFPPAAVRGESSPGYTSPDHPEVPARMAAVLPTARLVYLVRDPIDRALSQYRHHVAEGTERRPVGEALLDLRSQYVARGLYYERLRPFLVHYDRAFIAVVRQEQLRARPAETLRSLHDFLGLCGKDGNGNRLPQPVGEWGCAPRSSPTARADAGLDETLYAQLKQTFAADARRLRALTADGPWGYGY